MPIAWFLCPYQRLTTGAGLRKPIRYCVMADFTDQIRADGGDWREVEILGNRAIAKVRASDATLTTIAGTPTFRRIPTAILDDPLSTLTAGQRTAIRNEILDAGYTTQELNDRFPNLAQATLRQALKFLATRRVRPRYDSATDSIVLDGPLDTCGDIDQIDRGV